MAKAIIFAPLNDAHASAVNWALGLRGVKTLWAPSTNFYQGARLSVAIDSDGLQMRGAETEFSSARSIWLRRAGEPNVERVAEQDRRFVQEQWSRFQRNVFDVADGAIGGLWINDPVHARVAESKLLQLKVAREIGIPFPETVFGNDSDAVRQLIGRCGEIVFKQFFGYMWKSSSTGVLRSSNPALLDASSELPDEAMAVCPGIYQRYVEKSFDIRVTVIGKRMFPVRLSRRSGGAYLDWRPHIYDEDMLVERFSLPIDIEEKLGRLMERLGLVFGCIDLVADLQGHLFFLGVNQQGQFLFVEEAIPDMPLLEAMVSMMAEGRVDYSLNGGQVNFADYLASDEYQRILSAPQEPSEIFSMEE